MGWKRKESSSRGPSLGKAYRNSQILSRCLKNSTLSLYYFPSSHLALASLFAPTHQSKWPASPCLPNLIISLTTFTLPFLGKMWSVALNLPSWSFSSTHPDDLPTLFFFPSWFSLRTCFRNEDQLSLLILSSGKLQRKR